MEAFRVHILAADKNFYEGPCVSFTIPTSDGEQGILAHHSDMIAAILPGTLRYQTPDGPVQLAAVSSGMVKVERGDVLVLVDSVERPEEIGRAAISSTPSPGRSTTVLDSAVRGCYRESGGLREIAQKKRPCFWGAAPSFGVIGREKRKF